LYQNAIGLNGQRFIRTAFKVRDAAGKREIYNCPCGQIAIAGNIGVDAVDDNGSKPNFGRLWRETRNSQTGWWSELDLNFRDPSIRHA
jgi:hypothetical protein